MIICACLVAVKDDRVLLVRTYDNSVWYFPGGKIEPGEAADAALIRELDEELGIEIAPETLTHSTTLEGPSHDRQDECRLICFESSDLPPISPRAEISDAAWISVHDRARMAPLVQRYLDELATTT